MTRTKEEAIRLLEKLYQVEEDLVPLCTNFDFEPESDRHIFSNGIGLMLCGFHEICSAIYKKYPDLEHFPNEMPQ